MIKKRRRNPVSKHMHRYNKAAAFRDRKNDYKRKPKHPKQEQTVLEGD